MKKIVIVIIAFTALIFAAGCGKSKIVGSIESAKNANETLDEKESITPSGSEYVPGDTVILGSYEQDNDLSNGPEPIEWEVIGTRDGHKLLLSKYALDFKSYNRTDYGERVDITWEKCTLREWLNNDFYNTAFSDFDKERIVTTHNENPDSYELYKPQGLSLGAEGGNATDDKVFLLSWTEARDYLGGKLDNGLGAEKNYNQNLLCKPTAYAEAQRKIGWPDENNDYKTFAETVGSDFWWLRSPGTDQGSATTVEYCGALVGYFTVHNTITFVRPAILIRDEENDSPTKPEDDTLKIGDTVIHGSYEQDNDLTNGSEPIEWEVIGAQDGHTLLLSKYVLECKQYNESSGDITWENCTLRSWLNNDFYNTAFSDSDKKRIVTVHNENPDSYELYKPWNDDFNINVYGAEGGNTTDDKVFLLSWIEAKDYLDGKLYDSDLGAGNYNQKLLCGPTAYAKAQGILTHRNSNDDYSVYSLGCCFWWLRSPGAFESNAATVNSDGAFYSDYMFELGHNVGVRPAILID